MRPPAWFDVGDEVWVDLGPKDLVRKATVKEIIPPDVLDSESAEYLYKVAFENGGYFKENVLLDEAIFPESELSSTSSPPLTVDELDEYMDEHDEDE